MSNLDIRLRPIRTTTYLLHHRKFDHSADEWGPAVSSGDTTKLAELMLRSSDSRPERALSVLRNCISVMEKLRFQLWLLLPFNRPRLRLVGFSLTSGVCEQLALSSRSRYAANLARAASQILLGCWLESISCAILPILNGNRVL